MQLRNRRGEHSMLPKMILFDYGQTLFQQNEYNALDGYTAMMKYIKVNPKDVTAEDLTALSANLFMQVGEILGYKKKRQWRLEVPQKQILHYLMEYYGLESELSEEELSIIYWDAACNGTPVKDAETMLDYLHSNGIRTGVVSNLSFSGAALKVRLEKHFPNHSFEWILSSTDVIFRKPEAAIFDLAIAKSGLSPEEIWYCGDDTIWDVEASYQVGMTPVWFRGALDEEQPIPTVEHIMVEDWLEFTELIQRLKERE